MTTHSRNFKNWKYYKFMVSASLLIFFLAYLLSSENVNLLFA